MRGIFPMLTVLALMLGMALPAAARPLAPLAGPADVVTAVEAGAVMIDIRAPKAYRAGHLPGAVNVPYGAWRGPRENPGALISDETLTGLLQSAGIAPDSTVVVVNEGDSPAAFGATARVYWTLKSAGLDDIAILNGGYKAWGAAGLALTTDQPAVTPTDDVFAIATDWAITRDEVRAVQDGEGDALLIDARPDVFFRAETKHPAARWAGTLTGAVNLVHETFFGADGRMRQDPAAVMAAAEAAGWTPGRTVVSFCNTGHWAASNWFALSEIGGIEDVRLYPESMAGWTRIFAPEG
ncbi:MAG: rhodanese-like domain-containing protein [Pseudomonadota bacterium]